VIGVLQAYTLLIVIAIVAALELPRALASDVPLDPRALAEIQRLLNAGDTQRAEEIATALVAANTSSYEAYETLGRVMDAEGQYQKADTAYQEALKLAPSAASPHISLGVSLVRRGLTTEAAKQFQAALASDPQNLTALLNAGNLELTANHFVEAEGYYRRAVGTEPHRVVALIGLTTALFGTGHKEQALETAKVLQTMNSPSVHVSLGLIFAKNSLYAEAARELEEASRNGAESVELFISLGQVYSKQKNYEKAKAGYFRAIDLNPQNALPYVQIGSDYLTQGKSALALAWLFRADQLAPERSETLFLLGEALSKAEYFDSAHSYLERYAHMKPDDAKGWLLLGDAYLNDEKLENALESYRKAVQLLPKMAAAHYLVGNAEYLLRHMPEAKRELLVTLQLDNSHTEGRLRLGEIAYHENADAAATKFFQAVLSKYPHNPDAAYDLARVYLRQGEYNSARDLLRQGIAERPDDIRFHSLLSQVYQHLGDDSKAAQEGAAYRFIKAEQDYQHRYVRHSHLYVE
jgi:tetratricopeptide (TPR) repeat protein